MTKLKRKESIGTIANRMNRMNQSELASNRCSHLLLIAGKSASSEKFCTLKHERPFFYLQMPRSPASSLVNALLITASDSNASLNGKRKFVTLIAESISFQSTTSKTSTLVMAFLYAASWFQECFTDTISVWKKRYIERKQSFQRRKASKRELFAAKCN